MPAKSRQVPRHNFDSVGVQNNKIQWDASQQRETHRLRVLELHPSKVGYVYFIEAEGLDRIKIGFSSSRPDGQRLEALRGSSPVRLRLLAFHCGDERLERAYHRRFAGSRLHGEWFRSTKALRRFACGNPVGGHVPDDEWVKTEEQADDSAAVSTMQGRLRDAAIDAAEGRPVGPALLLSAAMMLDQLERLCCDCERELKAMGWRGWD